MATNGRTITNTATMHDESNHHVSHRDERLGGGPAGRRMAGDEEAWLEHNRYRIGVLNNMRSARIRRDVSPSSGSDAKPTAASLRPRTDRTRGSGGGVGTRQQTHSRRQRASRGLSESSLTDATDSYSDAYSYDSYDSYDSLEDSSNTEEMARRRHGGTTPAVRPLNGGAAATSPTKQQRPVAWSVATDGFHTSTKNARAPRGPAHVERRRSDRASATYRGVGVMFDRVGPRGTLAASNPAAVVPLVVEAPAATVEAPAAAPTTDIERLAQVLMGLMGDRAAAADPVHRVPSGATVPATPQATVGRSSPTAGRLSPLNNTDIARGSVGASVGKHGVPEAPADGFFTYVVPPPSSGSPREVDASRLAASDSRALPTSSSSTKKKKKLQHHYDPLSPRAPRLAKVTALPMSPEQRNRNHRDRQDDGGSSPEQHVSSHRPPQRILNLGDVMLLPAPPTAPPTLEGAPPHDVVLSHEQFQRLILSLEERHLRVLYVPVVVDRAALAGAPVPPSQLPSTTVSGAAPGTPLVRDIFVAPKEDAAAAAQPASANPNNAPQTAAQGSQRPTPLVMPVVPTATAQRVQSNVRIPPPMHRAPSSRAASTAPPPPTPPPPPSVGSVTPRFFIPRANSNSPGPRAASSFSGGGEVMQRSPHPAALTPAHAHLEAIPVVQSLNSSVTSLHADTASASSPRRGARQLSVPGRSATPSRRDSPAPVPGQQQPTSPATTGRKVSFTSPLRGGGDSLSPRRPPPPMNRPRSSANIFSSR